MSYLDYWRDEDGLLEGPEDLSWLREPVMGRRMGMPTNRLAGLRLS